jgi:type IX secretion system PorP/SprF family membrane protein
LGLSVKNILEPSYKLNDVSGVYKDKRAYYLTGKYDFGITYTLDISPTFIVKTDLQTISTELGAIATYNQQYWAGINYRWQDAASVLIGGNFLKNTVKVGYAIDIVNFGTLAKSNTSHELFLRYSFGAPKLGKKSIIKTPRYNI